LGRERRRQWYLKQQMPHCEEWQGRAHSVSSYFVLRALAARGMPRERKI